MGLAKTELKSLSDALWAAEEKKAPIEALTKQHPTMTLEDAYQIQDLTAQWRMKERKDRLVGYKIGLTSREAQKHFNLFHPDYGHLFDTMIVPEETEINLKELIQPKIEGEIAFVLKKDLAGPGVTVVDAISAVDYVLASLEIVDSRIANWKITGPDTIADNGSSARVVLSAVKRKLDNLNLPYLGMSLSKNGEVALTAAGAAVMGNPINALVFLANELGRQGKTLKEGHLVLSGSLGGMIPVQGKESFVCEIGSLGKAAVRFSGREAV